MHYHGRSMSAHITGICRRNVIPVFGRPHTERLVKRTALRAEIVSCDVHTSALSEHRRIGDRHILYL